MTRCGTSRSGFFATSLPAPATAEPDVWKKPSDFRDSREMRTTALGKVIEKPLKDLALPEMAAFRVKAIISVFLQSLLLPDSDFRP